MESYGKDIQDAIAAQIKAEVAAKDWHQADLSRATGIPVSSLHRYLRGQRDIPLPVFVTIAQALGISHVELSARAQRRLEGKDPV